MLRVTFEPSRGTLMAAAAVGTLALGLATPSFAAGRTHHVSQHTTNVSHHAARVSYHGRRIGPAAAAAGVGLAAGTALGVAAANAAAPAYYAPTDYYDPYAGVYGAAPLYAAAPYGAYAAAPCSCGGVAYGYGPGPAYGYSPTYFPALGYAHPPFYPGWDYSYGHANYGYAPGPSYAYSYGYRSQPYASGRAFVEANPGYVTTSRGVIRTRSVSNEARYGYARAAATESGVVVEPRSSRAGYTRVSTSAERGASAGGRVPAERTSARGAPRASATTNAAGQCFTTTDKDRGFGYYGECKK